MPLWYLCVYSQQIAIYGFQSVPTNMLLSHYYGCLWMQYTLYAQHHVVSTEFHFLEVFLKLLILCMTRISTDLCHAHSLASLQWSEFSDQWMLLPSPYKGRGVVSMPVCVKKKGEKWPSQCRPRLFYSQPRQLPCAQHVMTMPAHLPLSCPTLSAC